MTKPDFRKQFNNQFIDAVTGGFIGIDINDPDLLEKVPHKAAYDMLLSVQFELHSRETISVWVIHERQGYRVEYEVDGDHFDQLSNEDRFAEMVKDEFMRADLFIDDPLGNISDYSLARMFTCMLHELQTRHMIEVNMIRKSGGKCIFTHIVDYFSWSYQELLKEEWAEMVRPEPPAPSNLPSAEELKGLSVRDKLYALGFRPVEKKRQPIPDFIGPYPVTTLP